MSAQGRDLGCGTYLLIELGGWFVFAALWLVLRAFLSEASTIVVLVVAAPLCIFAPFVLAAVRRRRRR